MLSYHAPRNTGSGILSLRLRYISGPGALVSSRGVYGLRFTLRGLNLAPLDAEDSLCLPMAVIVGDDEGSLLALLTSPSPQSGHFSISGDCPAALE